MADSEGYVPVYLPDRTVIGKAKISTRSDGVYAEISFPGGASIPELVSEELIGLSVVYQRADALEIIEEKEKPTDG